MSVKHEGIKVMLGEEERVIAPLTLRALRKLNPQLQLLATLKEGMPGEEQIIAITKVVHAALLRNYPEVTEEQVEDWLDMGNLAEVIAAVMSVAGMERGREGGPGGA
jgi:hypothetical protein